MIEARRLRIGRHSSETHNTIYGHPRSSCLDLFKHDTRTIDEMFHQKLTSKTNYAELTKHEE